LEGDERAEGILSGGNVIGGDPDLELGIDEEKLVLPK